AKGDGKVGATFLLQFLLAAVGRDALHQSRSIVAVQDFGIKAAKPTMVANDGRLTDGDVKVARSELGHRGQQFIDQNRSRSHRTSRHAGPGPGGTSWGRS